MNSDETRAKAEQILKSSRMSMDIEDVGDVCRAFLALVPADEGEAATSDFVYSVQERDAPPCKPDGETMVRLHKPYKSSPVRLLLGDGNAVIGVDTKAQTKGDVLNLCRLLGIQTPNSTTERGG